MSPDHLAPVPTNADAMLLDAVMPDFEATRIEHRVIDAHPPLVYDTALHVDFADALRRSPLVRGVVAVREGAERAVSAVRHTTPPATPPATMRLADMPVEGEWVRLGERTGTEFVFGAIGRFWGGETVWTPTSSTAFASFDGPGQARIAAALSVRSYGAHRTLLSYEARTQATDESARRAFLRYWRVVSPGVGMVLRSTLGLIDEEACRITEAAGTMA